MPTRLADGLEQWNVLQTMLCLLRPEIGFPVLFKLNKQLWQLTFQMMNFTTTQFIQQVDNRIYLKKFFVKFSFTKNISA